MKNITDSSLMNLIRQNNPAALAEIYDRYSHLVYSLAYQSVQNEQAAKEIVQLVFLRLWTTTKGFDPAKGKFVNWIITITRRVSIDYIRAEKKHRRTLHIDSTEWDQLPDTVDLLEQWLEQQSIRERIQKAYAYLSASQRQLIDMLYWQGYTISEIAHINNEPVGTVKSRLHQTLKVLRRHFTAKFEGRFEERMGSTDGTKTVSSAAECDH
jgi:RNA polymerase sigma-70 factor, ECF subfamily